MPSWKDRVITALSWWWVAAPLLLLTPGTALALGFPQAREEFGRVLGYTALAGAALAPAMGLVVASIGHRQPARRRFALMGAVSSVPLLFLWIFGTLLAECPDGYHC
jgi:hypothetical protein